MSIVVWYFVLGGDDKPREPSIDCEPVLKKVPTTSTSIADIKQYNYCRDIEIANREFHERAWLYLIVIAIIIGFITLVVRDVRHPKRRKSP